MSGIEASRAWPKLDRHLSNAVKSVLYVERANAVVGELLAFGPNHHGVTRGRICRRFLAHMVGCGYATLTQNADLRAVLERCDAELSVLRQIAAIRRPASVFSRLVEGDKATIEPLPRNWANIVRSTAERDETGEMLPSVPTIVFSDGLHEASARWLRDLLVDKRLAASSVLQYAKLLRPFLAFCRNHNRPWETVDNKWLVKWRNYLLDGREVQKRQANASLQVIFAFYVHCELSGVLRYCVSCYEPALLPEQYRPPVQFPLTAVLRFTPKGKRCGWTSPLLLRSVESSDGRRATPTTDDLTKIHRRALNDKENGLRNTLILTWVEDTGVRRAELLSINVDQIPDADEVEAIAAQRDASFSMTLVRKGGIEKSLLVHADTLFATHAYLRTRSSLVRRIKSRDSTYIEPRELFLSSTTGLPLRPDSLTKLMGTLFREEGLTDTNIHRVRARFAMDVVETLLDAFLSEGIEFAPGTNWVETLLQQASFRMGHRNPSSLRHYLTAALERRIRVAYLAQERRTATLTQRSETVADEVLKRLRVARELLADRDILKNIDEVTAYLQGEKLT